MKVLPIVIIVLVAGASIALAARDNRDSKQLFVTPAESTDEDGALTTLSLGDIDRHIYAEQLGLSRNASWNDIREEMSARSSDASGTMH